MTTNGTSISRRRALTGAATAGIGVPLLAACGDNGSDSASDTTDPTSAPSSSGKPTKTGKTGKTEQTTAPAAEGIPTSEVPVGGGLVVSEDQVVLTQPTAGEFRAFTAVCTHAQCLVAAVSDGTINCPCHGSQYSIEDGSVVGGPAPAPLTAVNFSVNGNQIEIA